MMDTYSLVQLGKKKQKILSDRAYALANGLTVQNISDWKAGRSKPSATNFLKIAISAGMDIKEALKYAEAMEKEKNTKQAGFANIYVLPFIGITGLIGMSLLKGSHLPAEAVAMGFMGIYTVYYVKYNLNSLMTAL